MTDIKYGSGIESMSGKLGDKVHTRRGRKRYVREVTKNAYIPTEARVKVTSTFGQFNREYGKLKDRQILYWETIARALKLKSLGSKKIIEDARSLFLYVNVNLHEIGEPMIQKPPVNKSPVTWKNVVFEYVRVNDTTDIIVHFNPKIDTNTKIILHATEPLGIGKRRVDDSWYKKLGYFGSEFKSGDSIKARYLQVFKEMKEDFYKICFKYREVHKKSGISNMERTYPMYAEPE